jgi:hypothetical protein
VKTVDLYTQSICADLKTKSVYTSLNSGKCLKFGLKANLLDDEKPTSGAVGLTDKSL